MRKFTDSQIQEFATMADSFLSEHGHKRESVVTGVDAWTVAHRSGIVRKAYEDRSVVDAHIQTALEKIFPNAVFRDRKRY